MEEIGPNGITDVGHVRLGAGAVVDNAPSLRSGIRAALGGMRGGAEAVFLKGVFRSRGKRMVAARIGGGALKGKEGTHADVAGARHCLFVAALRGCSDRCRRRGRVRCFWGERFDRFSR